MEQKRMQQVIDVNLTGFTVQSCNRLAVEPNTVVVLCAQSSTVCTEL
jgi:hypothetical protein